MKGTVARQSGRKRWLRERQEEGVKRAGSRQASRGRCYVGMSEAGGGVKEVGRYRTAMVERKAGRSEGCRQEIRVGSKLYERKQKGVKEARGQRYRTQVHEGSCEGFR